MNCGFVARAIDTGGAQKMMMFVVKVLAAKCDNLFLYLETDRTQSYDLPPNVKAVLLSDFNSKSKVLRLKKTANSLHKMIILHNLDSITAFGAYYSLVAVLAARRTNAKIICSERRSPQHLSFVWKTLSKYAYSRCDRVVFQLNDAALFYKKIKKEKKIIIPNPYLSSFDKNVPLAAERKKIICFAAARLEYEKGFDLGLKALIEVLKLHPDYSVFVYGNGDTHQYDYIIDNSSLSGHVIFKGLAKNVVEEIYDCAVFVLPSRDEGIPNILLESLGAGIPCVAFDCPPGGSRLLLGSNNERGILVPAENVGKLTKAVLSVIEDNHLSDTISNSALAVRTMFSSSEIAKMWVKVFEEALKINYK